MHLEDWFKQTRFTINICETEQLSVFIPFGVKRKIWIQ